MYESDIDDHKFQHHGEIVFPDTFNTRKPAVITVARIGGTPECAEDSTFCEDIDTYPYDQLKDVLPDTIDNSVIHFFGTDEAPPEIANRWEMYVGNVVMVCT